MSDRSQGSLVPVLETVNSGGFDKGVRRGLKGVGDKTPTVQVLTTSLERHRSRTTGEGVGTNGRTRGPLGSVPVPRPQIPGLEGTSRHWEEKRDNL